MNKKTILRLTESELVNIIENILSEGKPVKKEKLNPGEYNPRPTEEGIDRRRPRKRDYDMEVYGFSPTSVEEESDRRKKPRNKSGVNKDGFGIYTNEESDRRKKPRNKSGVNKDGFGIYTNEESDRRKKPRQGGHWDTTKRPYTEAYDEMYEESDRRKKPRQGGHWDTTKRPYTEAYDEMDEGFIDNLKDWWQDRKFRQPKYGSYVYEEMDEGIIDDLKRKFWRNWHNQNQRDQGFGTY